MFAALYAPHFALHALRRADPLLANKPLALIEGEGRKAVVTQASPEAAGVQPGYPSTLAMARCPGIVLRPRDPAAEAEVQRLLVACAFTLSPRVESTAYGLCTVDLKGADPQATRSALSQGLSDLARAGLPTQAGVAATPLCAAYAARQADPLLWVEGAAAFLSPLPIAFAEPSAAHEEVLRGWGIATLGDLTALPKAAVALRMGKAGVELWERASGEATRVLSTVEPARSFAAEWVYEPPIESMEPLLFKLRRFAERVSLELRGAGLVAQSLALTLLLENASDHRREFRLAEPTAQVDSWLRVIQAHLDSVRTSERVAGVRLVAEPTRPPEKQGGLFETGLRDPQAFWENLARIAALVGDDRVGTPWVCDTHRPDAFRLEKPLEVVPPPEPPPVHPAQGAVLRRFRPPWPVTVATREERPVRLSGALSGEVADARGPWDSSGEWWQARAWRSRTWLLELSSGGVYQVSLVDGSWWVEGVMD